MESRKVNMELSLEKKFLGNLIFLVFSDFWED